MLKRDQDNIKNTCQQKWNEVVEKAYDEEVRAAREAVAKSWEALSDNGIFVASVQRALELVGPRPLGLSTTDVFDENGKLGRGVAEQVVGNVHRAWKYSMPGKELTDVDYANGPDFVSMAYTHGCFKTERLERPLLHRNAAWQAMDLALGNCKSGIREVVMAFVDLNEELGTAKTVDDWNTAVMKFTLSIGK